MAERETISSSIRHDAPLFFVLQRDWEEASRLRTNIDSNGHFTIQELAVIATIAVNELTYPGPLVTETVTVSLLAILSSGG